MQDEVKALRLEMGAHPDLKSQARQRSPSKDLVVATAITSVAGLVTICLQVITYLHLTRSEQSSLKRCFLEITECFCKLKYLYY